MKLVFALTAGLALALASSASAGGAPCGDCGGNCCATCGCGDCGGGCCGKRCELKIGTKKIKVTCWSCECDTVCLPAGPSTKGCTHCENVCIDGACAEGACGDCGCNHKPVCKVRWTDWCPNPCGRCISRKKLVKHEVEKEVPDYKWVVVDCCADAAPAAPKAQGDDRPPMPPVPTPVSAQTRAKRKIPTKAIPKGAQVGQEYSLTDAEIKMVESQIQQTTFAEPVTPLVKAATEVAPVAKTTPVKAPVVKNVTPVANRNEVPWSLFSK